jgi:Tfp pilus assembly protein PilN
MKAVNLLPGDARHRGGASGLSLGQLGPAHVVLGVLVIVLAYVTMYVLTDNTISQRKAQLAGLRQQLNQAQGQIARFSSYAQFAKLAQQRAETVRQIAVGRFDWHGALADLSKVMPANASLQSVLATAAPGASVSGAGGSTGGSALSTGSLRAAINAPAFELKGCTATQDDVARLISRLRLINDVQRVTLQDSTTGAAGQGSPSAGSSAGAGAAAGSCAANGPSFDLVVFFQPLPGAPAGSGGTPTGPASSATAASTTASQTSSSPSQPVSNPSTSGGAAK